MFTIHYHKKEGTWHVNAEAYARLGESPVKTERSGNFGRLLDLASRGKDTVSIRMDFKPFPNANELRLIQRNAEEGAFYRITTFDGKIIDLDFYVNKFPFLGKAPMPEHIYMQVNEPGHGT